MEPATSIASSAPDQRQLRLISAAAQLNEERIRDILAEDPNSWCSPADHDALRQSLQKVAARGKLNLVRLLLDHGADVNAKPGRHNDIPAVFRAAEGGHAAVITELLAHGANPDWKHPRTGHTALFAAICRSHVSAIRALLDGGASLEARDNDGHTPLLYIASDKKAGKCSVPTLKLLVERKADLEARDPKNHRTPLICAVAIGNLELLDRLTSGILGERANLEAQNIRGRTALHIAAEQNRPEMVKLLLDRGANPAAVSDGCWTPLHNAAQSGHTAVIELLLSHDSKLDVNAELSNGMTPLHWAAFAGHENAVLILLSHKDVNLEIKDNFYRTPLLCAAEKRHGNIVKLLSPARTASRLPEVARKACEEFKATVVDFGNFRDGKRQLVSRPSVFELLYGWDEENDKPTVPTLATNTKRKPDVRWIHLPANNMAWAETLLCNSFIESGHSDIEGFKSLLRCFDQEHCGPLAHAKFMRTFATRIPPVQNRGMGFDRQESSLLALSEDQSEFSTAATVVNQSDASQPASKLSPRTDNGQQLHQQTPPQPSSPKPAWRPDNGAINAPAKSDTARKKGKGEQIADRHGKHKRRAKGSPGNPPGAKSSNNSATSLPIPWQHSRLVGPSGRLVLFMPFLHYETDKNRKIMSDVIGRARCNEPMSSKPTSDELLVYAYLESTLSLHPRRTLDQFLYHGIDTTLRDEDQVVYRYCQSNSQELKIFMVDQLWLWVLGRDLVVTCFPQRWQQPSQDPLNVLNGIIEETNAKTRPPMQTAYDLAMVITKRCAGLFDRHKMDQQEYQFLDMFESSIGNVTNLESQLFEGFNRASELSSRLRKQLVQAGHAYEKISVDSDGQAHNERDHRDPADELLDIGSEIKLLTEIKDIRDELNILQTVLQSQFVALEEFERHIVDEVRASTISDPSARRATDVFVADCKKRLKDQRRLLEMHLEDIIRMNRQSDSIYNSLTNLLDLKQKHSNALEARFARDQAVIAARQGETVMVFTLVTIVFLPMSFIAGFFAINFREWEVDGEPGLTIGFASKYMFGIGLGISILLIVAAFIVPDIVRAAQRFPGLLLKGISIGQRLSPRGTARGGSGSAQVNCEDGIKLSSPISRPRHSMNQDRNNAARRRQGHYSGALSPPPTAGARRKISTGSYEVYPHRQLSPKQYLSQSGNPLANGSGITRASPGQGSRYNRWNDLEQGRLDDARDGRPSHLF